MTTSTTTSTATEARDPGASRPRPSEQVRRRAGRLAGVGYVLLFVLAMFANFAVFESMVVPGDASATAANIAADPMRFRLAIVAFLAVFVIDVVVAWALHVVFRDVDHDVSLLAAWSRLVYTVFLGVALVFAFQALQVLGDAAYLDAIDPAVREAQAMLALDAFDTTWLIGLVAFGLHLVLLGRLVVRSGQASRVLGWLLVVAGVAYATDTLAHLVLADYESVATPMLVLVAVPTVVAEGWLGLWLLLRAGRTGQAATPAIVVA